MPKLEQIQKRAKRMMDDGLKLLRAGMSEAEYIAGAAAESARLHIASRSDRIDIYKALHELGLKVYQAASKDPGLREVRLTDAMMKVVSRVAALEREVRACESRISKLTITKKAGKAHGRQGGHRAGQ
ncbi:MAG: hypothetical protein JXA24_01640 [Proteobacteria bacterium]|nr:hypothetical protein [Pseudomonadota bacterium]